MNDEQIAYGVSTDRHGIRKISYLLHLDLWHDDGDQIIYVNNWRLLEYVASTKKLRVIDTKENLRTIEREIGILFGVEYIEILECEEVETKPEKIPDILNNSLINRFERFIKTF